MSQVRHWKRRLLKTASVFKHRQRLISVNTLVKVLSSLRDFNDSGVDANIAVAEADLIEVIAHLIALFCHGVGDPSKLLGTGIGREALFRPIRVALQVLHSTCERNLHIQQLAFPHLLYLFPMVLATPDPIARGYLCLTIRNALDAHPDYPGCFLYRDSNADRLRDLLKFVEEDTSAEGKKGIESGLLLLRELLQFPDLWVESFLSKDGQVEIVARLIAVRVSRGQPIPLSTLDKLLDHLCGLLSIIVTEEEGIASKAVRTLLDRLCGILTPESDPTVLVEPENRVGLFPLPVTAAHSLLQMAGAISAQDNLRSLLQSKRYLIRLTLRLLSLVHRVKPPTVEGGDQEESEEEEGKKEEVAEEGERGEGTEEETEKEEDAEMESEEEEDVEAENEDEEDENLKRQRPLRPSVFKCLLVQIIGNMCFKSVPNQNEVREQQGIPILLDCSQRDNDNPEITKLVTMAIRNLCEGNNANQAMIASLQKLVDTPNPVILQLSGKNQSGPVIRLSKCSRHLICSEKN